MHGVNIMHEYFDCHAYPRIYNIYCLELLIFNGVKRILPVHYAISSANIMRSLIR